MALRVYTDNQVVGSAASCALIQKRVKEERELEFGAGHVTAPDPKTVQKVPLSFIRSRAHPAIVLTSLHRVLPLLSLQQPQPIVCLHSIHLIDLFLHTILPLPLCTTSTSTN